MITMLALTALAQDSVSLRFKTTPGATVEVLPRIEPDILELAVIDNRVSLHRQLPKKAFVPWVRDMEALSVGGGRTYMRIRVSRENVAVVPRMDDQGILLRLEPGEPPEYGPLDVPVPDRHLFYDPPPRRPVRPPERPLVPLIGDASLARIDPTEVPIETPSWAPSPTEVLGELLTVDPVDWQSVDGYRRVLTESPKPEQQLAARYRLAQAHLALQLPREADYYISAVLEDDTVDWPADAVHLVAAQAKIGLGEWESAREHCVEAARAGADRKWTLPCLGAVSFATGNPAPTDVARAIGSMEEPGSAEHLVLAAQLLASDHRYDEAERIAKRALKRSEEPDARAWLTLGDAQYLQENDDSAADSWTHASRLGLGPIVAVRRAMLELSASPRRSWGKKIPWLDGVTQAANEPAAIEAAYVLAQIELAYSDPEGAAQRYAHIWDTDPELALRSDIPERQLEACEGRILDLAAEERWADEVVFAKSCWRPALDFLAADTSVQESLADAWQGLGLDGPALTHQRRAVAVRNQLDRDTVDSLQRLAELYTRTGRPKEALETVAYVRARLPAPERDDPRLLLREAEAHLAMDAEPLALAALARAERLDPVKTEATRLHGLLDATAGRCVDALRRLAPFEDSGSLLARSRCHLELGDLDAAARDSELALASTSDELQAEAAWIRAATALKSDGALPDEIPGSDLAAPIWGDLLEEERKTRDEGRIP